MRTRVHSSHVRWHHAAALLTILGGWWISPQHASAQVPPPPGNLIVTITSPTSGATVTATITVSASVSPAGVLVGGVQFKLDGGNLGAEDTTAPYAVPWSTTGASNGSHTLTAVARDALGLLYASRPVTVTVSNAPPPDTTPPAVGITSPVGGATVSGTTSVSATASDNVGVAGVQFLLDGAALGAEDTASPYSVSWSTTGTSNGSHTLTATARDAAGNRKTSAPVTVTVSNAPPPDTTPPTVSITSPAGGATVSGTTSVAATASDNVGVAGVQFLLDGAALGAEDTTSPYGGPWSTTGTSNGPHTLTATARDAAGNKTTSAPVTVTVSNAPPPDTTRFEETAATFAPAGAWTAISSASAGVTLSGGSAGYAGADGATASFAFSGTGVSWIGFKCEQCGIARVSLDGAVVATVDTYAPTRPAASGAMFSTTGLAAGSHTLVVEATGTQNTSSTGTFVVVDAYDVAGGSGNGVTRIEETAPSVAYVGTWVSYSRADLSGGTIVESTVTNDTATLTFNGTGVSWIGFKATWAGIAQVYLDGALKATVDTYAPAEQAQAVLYTASGLAAVSHTLMIKVTGTWNPAGCCAGIVVDAFDVSSGGGGGSPPSDTTPPTVDVTSPGSGATVSGTTTVSATASDNVGVAGVQFLLDGAPGGAEDATAPYSVSWDTTTTSNGSHTLTATARDAAGNRTTSAPVTVTVSNVPPPSATRFEESSATLAPAASWFGLTSAQAGVTLSGDFAVYASDTGATATFTFTGTGVSWIGFNCERCGIARVSLDGAVVATVDTYAPSRPAASGAMFSQAGLAAGSHTLVIAVTGTQNPASTGVFIAVDAFDVM